MRCHRPHGLLFKAHPGACCGDVDGVHHQWWTYGNDRLIFRPGRCMRTEAESEFERRVARSE